MENKNLMNYFSQQVNLYLDDRLTEESKQNLLHVVNQDPKCSEVFNSEKSFRDFIKNNVRRPGASDQLISDIRDKIS